MIYFASRLASSELEEAAAPSKSQLKKEGIAQVKKESRELIDLQRVASFNKLNEEAVKLRRKLLSQIRDNTNIEAAKSATVNMTTKECDAAYEDLDKPSPGPVSESSRM
ncbi:hypothetical protein FRC09_007061 [Ceratobasidium sp. 395]|nr:hypothetical protein FRC09_007061 [Ceratobasidium sp. 395]